jgi:hypothetical protein
LIMALTVGTLDRSLRASDLTACFILVFVGAASYVVLCWLLDISHARRRLKVCLAFFKTKFANTGIG